MIKFYNSFEQRKIIYEIEYLVKSDWFRAPSEITEFLFYVSRILHADMYDKKN